MAEQTDTDIANLALDLLSEPPMADIQDPNGAVQRRIARLYPTVKEIVLKKHWWTPARGDADLAAVDGVDVPGFSTVVQLPADCLLIWTLARRQRGWTRVAGPAAGRAAGNFAAPTPIVYGRNLPAAEIPAELALYIGAELADIAKTGGGIDLSGVKMKQIRAIADDREDDALDICGTEGGEDQPFRSRFIDALNGICPQRGGSA